MKKLIAWLLLITLTLGLFAGCRKTEVDETTEPDTTISNADIEGINAAIDYLKNFYKDDGSETPVDYERFGIVRIGGVPYEVVWTVDVSEDLIKIVVNDDGTVTIDVNEDCEEDTPYVLTATVTDAEGNTATHSWKHILPKAVDMVSIVKAAYALQPGESLPYESTLRGKITAIKTPYSEEYKNITVVIEVEGAEDMPIECYRLKGEGVEELCVGDIITVKGTLKNYNGTIEFDSGCILMAVVPGERVKAPDDMKQIVDEAYALGANKTLPYEATLTGEITEIGQAYDSYYGNITVTIEVEGREGYPIVCYRLKGSGVENLKVTDIITVKGYITNYVGSQGRSTIEFTAGCQLLSYTPGPGVYAPTDPAEIMRLVKKLGANKKTKFEATLTGVVTEINAAYSSQYENISVTMDVNGTSDEIYCYRIKGNGASSIAVGDTITVKGYIMNYVGDSGYSTIEFVAGSKLLKVVKGVKEELPSYNNIIATEPEAGTAYKFGVEQGNLSGDPWLYFNGKQANSYYLGTSEDGRKAVDVYLAEVSGGYNLYFKDATGATKYINIAQNTVNGSVKTNVLIQNKASTVYTFNKEYNTLVATLADGEYYIGTYNQYSTMSASPLSKIGGSFPAYLLTLEALTGPASLEEAAKKLQKEYPNGYDENNILHASIKVRDDVFNIAWSLKCSNADAVKIVGGNTVVETKQEQAVSYKLIATLTKEGSTESITVTFEHIVPAIPKEFVENPVVGTPYKLGVNILTKTALFTGKDTGTSYRLEVVDDSSKAVDVYLEAAEVSGGYRLYFKDGETKTYVRLYEYTKDDGKQAGTLELTATKPAEYYTYDKDIHTLIYTKGENSYYMGCYLSNGNVYENMTASSTYYITGENAGNLDVTQYPARFYAQNIEITPPEADTSDSVAIKDGTYVIATTDGIAMTTFDGNYGYFNPTDVKIANGKVSEYYNVNLFTVKNNGDGTFKLLDSNGKYIYMKGTYNNFNVSETEPAEGANWMLTDAGNGTYYLVNIEKIKTLGYSTDYSSFGAYADEAKWSKLYVIAADKLDPSEEPENPGDNVSAEIVSDIKEGTAYKLGTEQGNLAGDPWYYFTGKLANSYYLGTSDDSTKAVDVFVKKVSGGFNLYFVDSEGATKYINIVQAEVNGSTKTNMEIADEAKTVYSFNEEYKTLVATLPDGEYYMGTYNQYSTISASSISKISSSFPAHLVILKELTGAATMDEAVKKLQRDYPDGYNADRKLPASIKVRDTEFTVSWALQTANAAAVKIENGKVVETSQEQAVSYKLIATITRNGSTESTTVTFEHTVPAIPKEFVENPVVGTPYKLGVNIIKKTALFTGKDTGTSYRLEVVDDSSKAVDVYLEAAEVSGGYRLYFMDGETKTYVRLYEYTKDDGKLAGTLELTATKPAEYYTYDKDIHTLIYTKGENSYYMGCYLSNGTVYENMTASSTYYITGENAGNLDVTQYPARFYPQNIQITPPESEPEPDKETLSIAEAIALGQTKEHNDYTTNKYQVTGVITEVYNTTFGNMKITDGNGNTLTVYGTWSADGETRYDALTEKPIAGDTVTVYGVIGQYSGTSQMKNGWIISYTEGEHTPTEPTPTEPTPTEPSGDNYVVVDAPVIGTVYKFGMVQGNLQKTYYLNGQMDSYYMATVEDPAAAVDVYLEATDGGYYLYAMVSGAKKYINMVVSDGHVNGKYEDTASTVYTIDEESKTVVTELDGEVYWFGTRNDKNYTTMGPAKKSYNGFYGQFYALSSEPAPSEPETTEPETTVPTPSEPDQDTLSIVEANELGLSYTHNTFTAKKYKVTGKITEIKSETWGNMNIADDAGNTLYIYGLYNEDGSVRYDAMTDKPVVGDTITVYGIIGQYNGTAQMKNGWLNGGSTGETPTEPETTVPTSSEPDQDTLSIVEANELGLSYAHNTFTAKKYKVTGKITEIKSETWGNMNIADDAGNTLYIYGLYNEDGSVRYDAMTDKPVVGDTITVYGIIGQYNGTAQMKNGWLNGGSTGETPTEPETTVPTPSEPDQDTLSIVEANELGLSYAHNTFTAKKYKVTGKITEIKSETWGNMNIADDAGNTLYIYGLYNEDGSVRYDAMTDKPVVGDTITVYGIIGQYNGTAQMKDGWLNGGSTGETPTEPETTVPTSSEPDQDTLSIVEANELGLSYAHNTFTAKKYKVTGKITEIKSETWGNMNIADDAGNTLYIYGLYNEDGSVRYDAMTDKPVVGDTITVYGIIGQYNGTAQMKNGWLNGGSTGETPTEPETTVPTEPTGGVAMIDRVANLTAGTYYMSGYLTSYTSSGNTTDYSNAPYHVWDGKVASNNSNGDLATKQYSYADGTLTGTGAGAMKLVAVEGKENTYYIMVGDQYLYSSEYANRRLALGSTKAEWVATDNANGGITLTTTMTAGSISLGTAGAQSNLLRSYKNEGTLKYGLVFFAENENTENRAPANLLAASLKNMFVCLSRVLFG